jgi:predicted dehydrogenase
MRHFLDCVARQQKPRESFADGYVVNCVIDAAYRSAQSKRWEKVEYD